MTPSAATTEAAKREYDRHLRDGRILLGLAIGSLAIGLTCFYLPNLVMIFVFAILAFTLANPAFDHLEKAAKFKSIIEAPPVPEPMDPPVCEMELVNTELKNGDILNVHVQIRFLKPAKAAHALPIINGRLIRSLQIFGLTIDSLAENPYPQLDAVFADAIEPLRAELGLEKLVVETINVHVSKARRRILRGRISARNSEWMTSPATELPAA